MGHGSVPDLLMYIHDSCKARECEMRRREWIMNGEEEKVTTKSTQRRFAMGTTKV